MARAQDAYDSIVSVGIRSVAKEELDKIRKDVIVYANELINNDKWIDKTIKGLKNDNIYITIDLDVFDPAIVRDTSTPEPGGIDWKQMTDLIKKLLKKNILLGLIL